MNLLDRVSALKLVVVTGKGGVGKSTLAAALGKSMARRGRRTLLLEIDPRESLYQLLGVPPSGGNVEQVDVDLYVQNLSPRAVLDQVIRETIRVEMFARRVLSSTIYQHFAEAAPGLKEVAALGHALRVVEGKDSTAPVVDTVVLDAPATGHGVSLLAAPRLVSDVIQEGPFGRMSAELAEFVETPEVCGILVVTAAEEMPVQEAIEMIEALDRKLSRRPEGVVVNSLYPAESDAPGPSADPLLRLWHERRGINDRELERLARAWDGPRVELPLLPFDRGAELTSALAEQLEATLRREPAWT